MVKVAVGGGGGGLEPCITDHFQAQVELKKSLHREARINKEKLRDHKAKKILDSIPRDDDGDFLTLLPDETLHPSPGESCNFVSKTKYLKYLKHHQINFQGAEGMVSN